MQITEVHRLASGSSRLHTTWFSVRPVAIQQISFLCYVGYIRWLCVYQPYMCCINTALRQETSQPFAKKKTNHSRFIDLLLWAYLAKFIVCRQIYSYIFQHSSHNPFAWVLPSCAAKKRGCRQSRYVAGKNQQLSQYEIGLTRRVGMGIQLQTKSDRTKWMVSLLWLVAVGDLAIWLVNTADQLKEGSAPFPVLEVIYL